MKPILITLSFILSIQSTFSQHVKYSDSTKQIRPTLFADLGEPYSTLDSMAIDKKGHPIL